MSENDKMKPEIKEQWVAALRSGEYDQGEGALCSGGNFCCLGVLADLAVKAGVQAPPVPVSPHSEQLQYPTMTKVYGDEPTLEHTLELTYEGGITPTFTVEWAGLPDANPHVFADDGARHGLASLNDNGATFAELANLIEASL